MLAANPADFARKNRRRLLARIATGDYDAVIVGHTSVGFMETPTEDLNAIITEKLAGLKEALAQGPAAAKASEFVVYPEAPHAFHADYRGSYRKGPAEDGWQRLLAWLKRQGVA